jgi:hypothetical protein
VTVAVAKSSVVSAVKMNVMAVMPIRVS